MCSGTTGRHCCPQIHHQYCRHVSRDVAGFWHHKARQLCYMRREKPSKYAQAYPKQGQPLNSMRNLRGTSLETIPSDRQLPMCAALLLALPPDFGQSTCLPFPSWGNTCDKALSPYCVDIQSHSSTAASHFRDSHCREDLAIRSNSEPDSGTPTTEDSEGKEPERYCCSHPCN